MCQKVKGTVQTIDVKKKKYACSAKVEIPESNERKNTQPPHNNLCVSRKIRRQTAYYFHEMKKKQPSQSLGSL